jgi:hypothetical protein
VNCSSKYNLAEEEGFTPSGCKLLNLFCFIVRKERDSNPRNLSVYTLSKRAH